jgi:hypothetical protein
VVASEAASFRQWACGHFDAVRRGSATIGRRAASKEEDWNGRDLKE